MSKCGGLHCPGCGHGSGGGAAIALVVVILVACGTATARAVWAEIVTALEITGYVLLSLAGLGVAGLLSYGAYRFAVYRSERRTLVAEVISVESTAARTPAPQARPALEAPRTGTDGWPLPGRWDEVGMRSKRDAN